MLSFLFKKTSACEAPIRSLRFNHSGNVLACCFNRGYVFGKFPEQSINEIWFGEKRNKLTKALSKTDFSLGCLNCEYYVKDNRKSSGAFQYDYLKEQKQYKNYPTMFDFELGSSCNFECIMCSGEYSSAIRKNRENKKPYYSPYEEFSDEFIDQLTPFIPYLKEMRFLGGEPFLMNIYYKIWDKVIELNPTITLTLTTNGSILNKKVETLLDKGNFNVSISIDSIVKETYESICINGKFDDVLANIFKFQKYNTQRGYTTILNICVMRQNWKEIPNFFNFCNEHNFRVVTHTVEYPLHTSIWNLPSDELQDIYNFFNSSLIEENISSEVYSENLQTFNALIVQAKNWIEKAIKREATEKINSYKNTFFESLVKQKDYKNYNKSIDYKQFILSVLDQFPQEYHEKIYQELLTIDMYLIIDEINISSEERIYERLKLMLQS